MAKRSGVANKRGPKKTTKTRGKKPPGKSSRAKAPRTRAPKRAKAPASPARIATQHVDFLTYKAAQVAKFYGEYLELRTEFRDMDGVSYLVVKTSATSSLGFMPPHPEMRSDQPPPREPSIYFMVDDVDRAYEYLLAKGGTFVRPPETMPWGHRVLAMTDPEGRTVMLAAKVEMEE